MKTPQRPLVLLLHLTLLVTAARAQDWPQWRGPNRDAKAAAFTVPKTWPKELTRKWKVTIGDGVATPALVGDKLYVFSRQEGNEITRCLNATTGDQLWEDKYEAQGAQGPAAGFSGPRSSPTVAQGKVVTLGVRGTLSCLDAASGKKLWRKDEIRGWPGFFTSSSPLIAEGLCIAQLGGKDNGAIVAYDLATGEEKWKTADESPAYASPVLLTVGGVPLSITVTDKKIVAVQAKDGKVVWETPFSVQGMGAYNAATPLVDGETIIFSGSRRGVKAVKINKSGDSFTATEVWNNPDKSVQFNSPVLKDGFVYGLTQNNELFCLNAKDGQTAWSTPMGEPAGGGRGPGGPAAFGQPAAPRPGGPPGAPGGGGPRRGGGGGGRGGGYGSIVDAGAVLLALTPASQLVVFEPSAKEYKKLAAYKVAESQTHAYPVVSGNRIFIKDKDSVTLWLVE